MKITDEVVKQYLESLDEGVQRDSVEGLFAFMDRYNRCALRAEVVVKYKAMEGHQMTDTSMVVLAGTLTRILKEMDANHNLTGDDCEITSIAITVSDDVTGKVLAK